MRVIKRTTLVAFWKTHADAEQPLKDWFLRTRRAKWRSPVEVKQTFRTADIVNEERVVFDISGNKYRMVVAIKYSAAIVWIKFLGTHAEYDRIDVATVARY